MKLCCNGMAWWAVAGMLAVTGWAAEEAKPAPAIPPRLPVEDFSRYPEVNRMKLSPDGKNVGYLLYNKKDQVIGIAELDSDKEAKSFGYAHISVGDFDWLNSKRLLLWVGGLAAIDRDFSRFTGLTGYIRYVLKKNDSNFIYTVDVLGHKGSDPHRILLNDLDSKEHGREAEFFPNVLELDESSGMFRQHLKNPGRVGQWIDDWEGRVRFGVVKGGKDEDPYRLILREAEDKPWSEPRLLGPKTEHFWISGMNEAEDKLYLSREGPTQRWELALLDLKTGQVAEKPLFRAGEYDLTPPEWMPEFAGEPLATQIYAPVLHRLLGVRYVTDGSHEYWFAEDMENFQKQFQTAHADTVNLVVSMDAQVNHLIVLSFSARDPGIYWHVDLKKHVAKPVARRAPWIDPAKMADTYPVKCAARDGLVLHGYLTLPTGRGRKNLPMVTLVHGGPWVRDVWGYDPEVQFLANRGYAVLQVNYRGSSGYGKEFLDQGKKEIGQKIQDDIIDMTQWAVDQGVADPHRLAIMGGSYGGYSAFFALAKTPDYFRCGIAFAGVSDWSAYWKFHDIDEYKEAYRYWSSRLGDLTNEETRKHLAEVSPVNMAATMTAPLLIVQGEKDTNVPPNQARLMEEALKKAGHPPQTLSLPETGHWLPQREDGIKYYTQVEKFLAANLGPN